MINYKRFEKNIKGEKLTFANILFIWLFLSLLPQTLFAEARESSASLVLKAVFFLGFLLGSFIYLYRKKARANPMEVFLGVLLCLIQIISDYLVGGQSISFGSIVYITISFAYYLLFFGLMYDEEIDGRGIYRIAFLYDFFILYAAAYNIMLYGSSMVSVFTITNTYEMVMRSFFTNRNTFAMFLMFAVILSVFRIANPASKGRKAWYWFVLIVTGYSMFCTFARTSLLATAVFLVLYFVCRRKGEIGRRLTKVLIGLALLVFVLYITGAYQFVLDIMIRPEAGSTGRVDRWELLLGRYLDGNLFFGGNSDNDIMPHNTYVHMLLAGGLVMLTFFLILYLKIFKKIVFIIKHDREYGIFFLSLFISYVCIASLTETVMPVASPANSVICTMFALMLPHYYYNHLISKQKKLKAAEAKSEVFAWQKEKIPRIGITDITTEGSETVYEQ